LLEKKIMEPREFTDPNVRFWLLNGREEEIKVTEPSLNYPIPENCRFVAEVDERPVVDVRFEFNAERKDPTSCISISEMGLTIEMLKGRRNWRLTALKQTKIYSRSTL
jgi:hypothetical protein